MDDELDLISLVAQLHLSDLADLNQSAKGKGRLGKLSDEQVAFQIYERELQAAQVYESDRRFALSLEAAVRTDGALVAQFAETEQMATRDRELALAASRGRPLPRGGDATTQSSGAPSRSFSPDPTLPPNRPSTSRLPGSYPVAPPPPYQSTSSKPVTCVICGDRHPSHSAIQVPCAHRHHYDPGCLRDLFLLATRDESLMPPRCDGVVISLALARPHLSATEVATFERKAIEFGTANRVYCSKATCSEFLGAVGTAKVAMACRKCASSTCRACKAAWHGTFGLCGTAKDEEAVAVLVRHFNFQRCPGCQRLVELQHGCFHMCVSFLLLSLADSLMRLIQDVPLSSRVLLPLRRALAGWKGDLQLPDLGRGSTRRSSSRSCRSSGGEPTCGGSPSPRSTRSSNGRRTSCVPTSFYFVSLWASADLLLCPAGENHECTHQDWYLRQGPGQCATCFHHLPRYLLVRRSCPLPILLESWLTSSSLALSRMRDARLRAMPQESPLTGHVAPSSLPPFLSFRQFEVFVLDFYFPPFLLDGTLDAGRCPSPPLPSPLQFDGSRMPKTLTASVPNPYLAFSTWKIQKERRNADRAPRPSILKVRGVERSEVRFAPPSARSSSNTRQLHPIQLQVDILETQAS